ncbi:MAG: S46 family peptidase [Myxococcota bacterium]
MRSFARFFVAGLLSSGLVAPALADEGMWPYNMVPVEAVAKDHGYTLTDSFLANTMRSSVRFNNGGSGSFVSARGLVMTNHHVGADCIQKLASGDGAVDIMKEGFYAAVADDEKRCPDLELNQLQEIEDVTEAVRAAATGKPSEAAQNAARKAEMARLEQSCAEASGLRCDVVTLYAGGAYHLYKYKKYTDVRLVFAPEIDAAFFGGDDENFTYPRHCLDAAFFRVWENGAPATLANFLPFDPTGADDGDLVFVSGHPGSTDRFAPLSKLELLRDTAYPFVLEELQEQRALLRSFMALGGAEERAARDDLFGVENSIKALSGYLSGLRDPALFAAARSREAALVQAISVLPDGPQRRRVQEAWPKLAAASRSYASFYRQYAVTERWLSPAAGTLGAYGRHLLRLAEELPKPSERRLREYRDSNLKSLELSLFSEAPVHKKLEEQKLRYALENVRNTLGENDPLTVRLLAGRTPAERAAQVIDATRLDDVAFRKELRTGGKDALARAQDPLLQLLADLDTPARQWRQRYENEVEAVETAYSGRIMEAWALAYGTRIYPDATFTLRINPGVVRGYDEGTRHIPWRTQLGSVYSKHKRAQGKAPYALSPRWLEAMGKLNFSTPYNFVSTNDIIGGNSGSPVISTDGRVVGLIFDGNLSQLPNRFVYRSETQRSVSVHVAGMLEVLRKVYAAEALVKELLEDENTPRTTP